MQRKYLTAALVAAVLGPALLSADAATTTRDAALTDTYSDLGTGPLLLGANGSGNVIYQIGDAADATAGAFIVQPGEPPRDLSCTTAHVWARGSKAAGVKAVVTSGDRLTCGGGSNVTIGGNAGTPTQSSISVTNSSTTVLAAATATTFVKLCVALSAANGIWVRWDGGTATAAAPAEFMAPGQCDAWVKSTGFLPTSQINAISATTVPVSLIFN